MHQFNNELLRILVALTSGGIRSIDAFISKTFQKHLFRELKLSDTAITHPEAVKWQPMTRRFVSSLGKPATQDDQNDGDADEPGDTFDLGPTPNQPELPTKQNPVILITYGQLCLAAKSYQSAICKALYSLAFPR